MSSLQRLPSGHMTPRLTSRLNSLASRWAHKLLDKTRGHIEITTTGPGPQDGLQRLGRSFVEQVDRLIAGDLTILDNFRLLNIRGTNKNVLAFLPCTSGPEECPPALMLGCLKMSSDEHGFEHMVSII